MRIHLIPNSHIDPVWLWDQYEGIDEVLNTFRSACDRLDEYPNLTFSTSSLQFFEWLREFDRKLFQRVSLFVADGRWEIVGDWWVEADSNLPGGASLRKQAEVARAFRARHFPSTNPSEVAFLPDTFGHPADLPQILSETGFKYLVFCRPNANEKPDLPEDLFYWTYRGHRVLAYRLRHHYFQEDNNDEQRLARVNDSEYKRQNVNAFFFGLGDHGGGPTKKEIDFFKRFTDSQPPGDVGFSSCATFFAVAEQQQDIPTYTGDLHMHAVGCYSVVRDVKQLIRGGEAVLAQAERALDIGSALGEASSRKRDQSFADTSDDTSETLAERAGSTTVAVTPAAVTDFDQRSRVDLERCWKTLLFNQFHDIYPGSMSPTAAEQAKHELGGIHKIARRIIYAWQKRQSLKHPPSISEGEFRLFNTLPFPITLPLSIQSFVYYRKGAPFRDADGRLISIQKALPDVRCDSDRWIFVDTLPARGFKSYHFESGDGSDGQVEREREPVNETSEVERSRAVPVPGVPWLEGVKFGFVTIKDDSDTWSHGVSRYGPGTAWSKPDVATTRGSVFDSAYHCYADGSSAIDVVFTRYADLPGLYTDIRVRWGETRSILKLEIEQTGLAFNCLDMQGAVGSIRRAANGVEHPMHRWLRTATASDLSANPADPPTDPTIVAELAQKPRSAELPRLTIIQDGAFACDARDNRVRITLVRSSLYGFDEKTKLAMRDPQRHTGFDEHHFRLLLLQDVFDDEDALNRAVDTFTERVSVVRETPSFRARR